MEITNTVKFPVYLSKLTLTLARYYTLKPVNLINRLEKLLGKYCIKSQNNIMNATKNPVVMITFQSIPKTSNYQNSSFRIERAHGQEHKMKL